MLPSLVSSVFLAMRDRVRSVVEIDFGQRLIDFGQLLIDFGQRLIEFNVGGYRDGLDRIRYQTMGGGLCGVLRGGVTGLDHVWYQAIGTWCHEAWIRFGSG